MHCSYIDRLHCKNIRIFTHILWRVINILIELVLYTFVSVNRRNDEALAYIAIALRFTDTNVYITGSV